jgi:hypothetical protein
MNQHQVDSLIWNIHNEETSGWYFVQDRAPCHTSESAIDEISQYCNIFPSWPPNSCDLNPIETLWDIKRELKWNEINNRAEAIAEIQKVWEEFPHAGIDSLIMSFERTVRMVRESEGRSIQPLLSAHKDCVPHGCAYSICQVSPWSSDEESRLRDSVIQYGKKWTELEKYFPGRSAVQLKNCFQVLTRKSLLKPRKIILPSIGDFFPEGPIDLN